MGRNPIALYKRDRIDPHPRKGSKRPQKRNQAQKSDNDGEAEPAAKMAAQEPTFVLPASVDIQPEDLMTDARPESSPSAPEEDSTSGGPAIFFGAKTADEVNGKTPISRSAYRSVKASL